MHTAYATALASADNFHTLASHFSHFNPPPFSGFSQQSLQALSQQALAQQPFNQPDHGQLHAPEYPRGSSLPVRFSPQAGLYDPNPNSLLHALRAHGAPSQLLGLHQQAEAMQQPCSNVLPGRFNSLKQELPEREPSDASLSGVYTSTLALFGGLPLVDPCPFWPCHAVVVASSLATATTLSSTTPVTLLTFPATNKQFVTGPPRQCLGQSDLHAAPARLNSGQASVLQQASGTLPQSQHSGHVQTTFGHATLEELRSASEKFAADRDWDKFHSPRNLLLALVTSDVKLI